MIARLFAPIGAKIFAGVAAAALLGLAVQTVRIEGAFCRSVKLGEKPACIVQGFKQQVASIRIDLEAVRRDRDQERANHQATKDNYRKAQQTAQQLERARLARSSAQQREINDDERSNYNGRIAAARAAAQRLRGQTGSARGGAAGAGRNLAVPPVSDAARGADELAGDRRLPADEALIATEQAIRLDALQSWVRRQHGVDPN